MGDSLVEDRAIQETNKYRLEKGEPIRIWYYNLDDYYARHEK